MAGALFLNVLSWGYVLASLLRYPIPIAMGLYYGGEALRSGWGPIQTFGAGMLAFVATGIVIQFALEARNVVIRLTAQLVTSGASLWVGFQMVEAVYLVAR
jgi:hypothetical protein